jgi:hypothetical protein
VRQKQFFKHLIICIAFGLPVVFSQSAFADSGSVTQVDNFIQGVIQAIAGFGGLVATLFIVVAGFTYITSTGNPERLEKAKKTLLHSGVGLAIIIGAFVISSIVTSIATKAFGS